MLENAILAELLAGAEATEELAEGENPEEQIEEEPQVMEEIAADEVFIPEEEPEVEEIFTEGEADTVTADDADVEQMDETQEELTQASDALSIEDIVAEVQDKPAIEQPEFVDYLDISIGDSGSSYIALNLSADTLKKTLGAEVEQMAPVMLMGNWINVALEDTIFRKNLLTGETGSKESNPIVTAMINQSIASASVANSAKLSSSEELSTTLDAILMVSEDASYADYINAALTSKRSRLSIVNAEGGGLKVTDNGGTEHSLEEVLWVLSL